MPPSSTKNREEKRDPEMHQTKKGNQWYFGTKIVHSAVVTAANMADAQVPMIESVRRGLATA